MKRFEFSLGVILLLVALPMAAQEGAAAQEDVAAKAGADRGWSSIVPNVPAAISELMKDRNYADAVVAIDKALAVRDDAKPDDAKNPDDANEDDGAALIDYDYLAYLKGRALHLLGDHDLAIAAYKQLEKDFPDSPWARRARFGAAVSYARKGDYLTSETIFKKEVQFLLSEDRKQQIADIYLEFADAYFAPPKDDLEKKPDYQKALQFYQRALEVGPKPDRRAEVELLVAQCFQKLNNHAEAATRYQQFAKDHKDSPLAIEARFRLGQCQLAQNQQAEARRTWQDLLADHVDAKSQRIAEATYNIAKTYNIPAPQNDEQLSLGVAALEKFIANYPGHKLASQAHLQIAQSYFNRGRHEDAVAALKAFLAQDRYADSDEVPAARNLLGLAYQRQRKFDEALAAWREYLAKHPTHQAWSDVQRQIIDTEFAVGADHRRERRYDEARAAWTEFLVKYPLDGRAAQILLNFGDMHFAQEKYDAAIADWRRLVSKYPGTNEASQAQFLIGAVTEDKLGKLAEALKEYKKVTWGGSQAAAKQRIAQLTAKALRIETERVFRTDETPRIKLTSRNVESVTVEAYVVDLESYFRKMHLAGGVEGLDIDLIDPDKKFEFAVPDYEEYKLTEHPIEIPLPAGNAGVMAVSISSKTQTATTLVIQSDLDMIIKSSRNELFVFAQNMRTGQAWPGARLLVSDGSTVYAEETTGDDGVLQKSFEQLKQAGDVRVFAVAEGNVASNIVDLSGVGVAQGLADKGYLYTDRPAYRPGQFVHVRGIIRRVAGDTYTVEENKKFNVTVYDNRDRLVHEAAVALSAFGSFHSHFMLPATSPQGQYRVVATEETKRSGDIQTYQGYFTVHEYKLEPVQLTVESDRTVYYRGEEITGKIVAKYYYGAPLAGREVRYSLAGGRTFTAKTNDEGEVQFKLPTRDYAESRPLQLVASLPERNLNVAKNFFLSTLGYSLDVSTVRNVYLAGDTFETTIKATDAEGEPVAHDITLKVLEQTRTGGRVGEVLVSEHQLTTDEKEGAARHTLKLDKGGHYILRAEGTDRFDNPIAAAIVVKISDDDDQVRLRILADRHTYKVGEEAAVTLHWREQPALALVTYQGARILDYKIVKLNQGANKLPIPMTAKLAPNFELSVAVMTDARAVDDDAKKDGSDKKLPRRFHVASSPFAVQRELVVKVQPRLDGKPLGEKPIRPGDELEVAITTTDPQGNPVSAEVSLAMVEQSLLKRFGPNAVAIDDFFRGTFRQAAVRTTSTVSFAYRPQTQTINKRLLAERDRIELAREEELALSAATNFDRVVVGVDVTTEATQPDNGGHDLFAYETTRGPRNFLPGQHRSAVDNYFLQNFGRPSIEGVSRYSMQQLPAGQAGPGPGLGHLPGGSSDSSEAHWGHRDRNDLKVAQAEIDRRYNDYLAAQEQSHQAQGEVARIQMRRQQLVQELTRAKQVLDNNDLAIAVPQGGVAAQAAGESWENLPEWKQAILQGRGTRYNHIAGPLNFTPEDYSSRAREWGMPMSGTPLGLPGPSSSVRQRQVVAVNNGVQVNFQLDQNGDGIIAQLEELREAGAVLVPTRGPQETGYWNPAIVTDKEGTATITLTAPDRSTAWKLSAKGVTAETLAGEADAEVVARKDLFGQLKLPLAFTDGDRAQISASVHNSVDKLPGDGTVEVTLKTTIGERSQTETKKVNFKAAGIENLVFDATLNRAEASQGRAVDDEVTFELTIAAGEHKDVVRRTLPIKPLGMPVFSTAAGESEINTTAQIAPPPNMPLSDPNLQILIGPSVEQSLLDIVLGPPPVCQIDAVRLASGLDVATSDLMAAVAVQKLLAGTRDQDSPQAASLDSRIRSSVSLLVSAQLDEGGWSWTGRGGGANPYTSARAVWALSLARGAGYTVPDDAMNRAVTYLQSQVATTQDDDLETQAILIHALAAADKEDFRVANRLYRSRPSLSNAALAYLALAFSEMDRDATANELLELLGQRDLDAAKPRRRYLDGSLPWNEGGAELRALYALALQLAAAPGAGPANGQTREQINWLMAHRTGHRWSPEKATGPAALAVAQWYSKTRFANEHYKLAVFVNDIQVKELDIDADAGPQTVDVPADLLKDINKKDVTQRVHFQITGRGRFTYQCILSGFVPADKLADTTQDWRVERNYEPAPLEFDGRPVRRGFGVLQGSYTSFRNPLTQLPVGRRGRVELRVRRYNLPSGVPQNFLEYLVVTEPLPAGTSVVENSVKGGFDRYELSPGAITFYIGSRSYSSIHYELHGYLAGQYRCGPSVVRNAYRADQIAVAKSKSLAVLPEGTKSVDKYRLTPQELWELGVKNFEAGNLKQASVHLNDLFANWNLKPDIYKQAAKLLLDIHLETGPAQKVVDYFEIIKQRWKDLEIPFDKVVRVGNAYHEIGEYESAYIVFRVVAESSFGRESGVAGFLQGQGEFIRSVDVMNDLLRQYPPEPYIASATYALAQRIYAMAPQAAADAKLREKKINRVDLVQQSLGMLDDFLTSFPDDPAADQASFSVASGLLELEAYKQAIAACQKFTQRYPDSQWLDSYWYVIGFCHFALGQPDEALAMCEKVAEAKRLNKQSGREEAARNKWRAIYIMGQVYHSLGQAAEAIREYTRVEERFADAAQAIEYFARKSIELPEVTRVKPGEKAEIALGYRNIPSCELKVYRIDLMKFSLLKRNLAEITKINLAGIRPLHDESIELGDGKDYRDREKALDLPIEDEGAYLIVARGGNLHTSGLVLVTPLTVEIQEDATSGRVRTTVKDETDERYVSEVHVKVIGSANEDFVSGETDLRGIFVADGINGTSTVIAQADTGSYAFFRGEQYLGERVQQQVQQQEQMKQVAEPSAPDAAAMPQFKGGKGKLLEQIFEDNSTLNSDQSEQLQKLYEGGKSTIDASKF